MSSEINILNHLIKLIEKIFESYPFNEPDFVEEKKNCIKFLNKLIKRIKQEK
jgi:hypothetical protein